MDNRALYQLIDHLTGEEPVNQDEQGGCVWCGSTGGTAYGYAGKDFDDHAPGCAWVAGRRALDGADVGTRIWRVDMPEAQSSIVRAGSADRAIELCAPEHLRSRAWAQALDAPGEAVLCHIDSSAAWR